MPLDETDKEILKGLLENGRMAYRELSERTGVTPPTVKSRVDNMKEQGIIEDFTVQVDQEALIEGQVIDALIEFETTDPEAVFNGLNRCEGALSVMKTADSKVVARFKGDRETFEQHILDKMPEAVTNYTTTLVTEEETKDPAL